ncbi:MAG: heavy-metal-associated domain-containing protein [Ferribacterium limneticum]
MKTSVMEVHDLLSVLTVEQVEQRFCEVPGVASATVNYAAGNVTVRYDETLLDVADIKVIVHQRGQQSAGESPGKEVGGNKPEHEPALKQTSVAAPASASPPQPAVAKADPTAPGVMPASAASPVEGQWDKPAPAPPPSPAAAAPNA